MAHLGSVRSSLVYEQAAMAHLELQDMPSAQQWCYVNASSCVGAVTFPTGSSSVDGDGGMLMAGLVDPRRESSYSYETCASCDVYTAPQVDMVAQVGFPVVIALVVGTVGFAVLIYLTCLHQRLKRRMQEAVAITPWIS